LKNSASKKELAEITLPRKAQMTNSWAQVLPGKFEFPCQSRAVRVCTICHCLLDW